MRSIILTLALVFTAVPALAAGLSFDLPNLTWPTETTTTSTKNCVAGPQGVCP